ncbi:MAG: hypothetical protein HY359_15315 [Candidatus Rokubacteria bacterium]|nr:hypothetical protein [Candidatus Rokubacteria bacterium]
MPFVCGARDLGEALRRIGEGAAMIRTKGEAGSGNIVEAVPHADPEKRARAIVQAATHYRDPEVLARVSEDIGEAIVSSGGATAAPSPRNVSGLWKLEVFRPARPAGGRLRRSRARGTRLWARKRRRSGRRPDRGVRAARSRAGPVTKNLLARHPPVTPLGDTASGHEERGGRDDSDERARASRFRRRPRGPASASRAHPGGRG